MKYCFFFNYNVIKRIWNEFSFLYGIYEMSCGFDIPEPLSYEMKILFNIYTEQK